MGTAALEAKLPQLITAMREVVLFEVFMALQKAHNTLYQYRCLELLEACRVSPRMLLLLQNYRDRLTMMARSGGYFERPFKGYQGVTQGDPLSPRSSSWSWMPSSATG